MRYTAAVLLLSASAATLAPPAAQAQTRIIARTNGWVAFSGTTQGGAPTCGLETRDPNTGRHFLLQRLAGQDRPILHLSRPSWNLGTSSTRPVRIVIDNRRTITGTATGAGREMSWPLTLDGPNGFEPAFRLGSVMRVEFPAGPDTPWDLSLRGTNAVMGAFIGCMRMMVIQPGEATPIQPLPLEEPLRPPAEAPPPGDVPRPGLPADKPVPQAPEGKPLPGAKPGAGAAPVKL